MKDACYAQLDTVSRAVSLHAPILRPTVPFVYGVAFHFFYARILSIFFPIGLNSEKYTLVCK